jgi:hypothetical protein
MTYKNETGKPLYLNADKSAVVEEGPDAAFLLVGAEGELTDEEAARYGLTKTGADKAAEKAEDKAADKAVEKAEDKGQAAPKKPA